MILTQVKCEVKKIHRMRATGDVLRFCIKVLYMASPEAHRRHGVAGSQGSPHFSMKLKTIRV